MKRRVHVLGTGGTIAGAQPDPGHYGYTAAKYGIDWLLNAVPGLDRFAVLSGEQVVNIGSQDMDDATWLQLARRLDAVLAADETDAALVVLNDEIHYARNAVKTGTSNPSAFSSMSRGLAGVTSSGRVEWFEQAPPAGGRSVRFALGAIDTLPRVDILHAHANMSVDLIDAAIAGGARGVVIAGVGAGNMSARAIERLHAAVASGVVVVRSSRVVSAMVLRNSELDDDRWGFVAAGDLNAPKSRVLLQLALTQTTDPRRIQQLFDQG